MSFLHPVKMMTLGCTNRLSVTLTFQTYMELCEVQKLWEVQYFYVKNLDHIYLTAKETKTQEHPHVYFTIPTKMNVSPEWLYKVQKELNILHPNSEFNLMVQAPDSTTSQYTITSGLTAPLSPEAAKERKSLLEKHLFIKREFNKMQSELYIEAKKRKSDGENIPTITLK